MSDTYQKIVVSGFLRKGNSVLVIKRSANERFFKEHYEIPGGKVDFGEDPSAALQREFMEETGLKIKVKKPFQTFAYTSHDDVRHTVEIVYTVELESDDSITLSESHTEYKWVTLEDIDNLVISEEMKESIRKGFAASTQRVCNCKGFVCRGCA